MSTGRTALLLGATGLVGGRCLERLLDDATYDEVRVLTRRATGRRHPRLVEVLVDFEGLAARSDEVRGVDVVSCLGTTIRKAGSEEAFRRVDHDYVVEVARLARANGARRMGLVSSVGADPASRVFYLRTKGETERDVGTLGFETLAVLRPSFLRGEREERRPGESAGIALARAATPLLRGPLRRYRSIDADAVAAALLAALRQGEPGVRVYEGADLERLARATRPPGRP